jgi:ABC-type Na+ efflux pump permease subunit
MPARHLLAGKIAGIGILGLAQVVAAGIAPWWPSPWSTRSTFRRCAVG